MRLISYLSPGFPEALFTALGQEIGADVVFVRDLSGPAPGDDPFSDGRADLGWVCSTSYVERGLRGADPTVRLVGVAWVPSDPASGGRPEYFGDVVVPADSPIRSFTDLAGRRVGCNDPVSLSGHWALRMAIADHGQDPDAFADLVFTGGHHVSLDEVVGGRIDAAVVDSVVRTTRARSDRGVAGLRIVERLGPWPVQPLVARASMADAEVASIAAALLALTDRADIRRLLHDAGLARLVAVDADHYDRVRAALAGVR